MPFAFLQAHLSRPNPDWCYVECFNDCGQFVRSRHRPIKLTSRIVLPATWKTSFKSNEALKRRTAICEAVKKKGKVCLVIRFGDLRDCVSFGTAENIVVDLLIRTLFTDPPTRDIYSTEQKFVSRRLIVNIMTKTAISLMFAWEGVFNVNKILHNDVPSEEHNLFCIVRQIELPTYRQAAVLVSCQDAWILTIDTHCNVA